MANMIYNYSIKLVLTLLLVSCANQRLANPDEHSNNSSQQSTVS